MSLKLRCDPPPHLSRDGTHTIVLEQGCRCVLLGTRGPGGYHGSFGSIDRTTIYDDLVREGLLTDVRSFLPIPNEMSWAQWIERVEAAIATYAEGDA